MEGFPEAGCIATDSGFINNDVYVEWVKMFIEETGGNCILIADQHISRFDLRAILLLVKANVKMILMPPHCTHELQPADVSFFGAFKGTLAAAATRQALRETAAEGKPPEDPAVAAAWADYATQIQQIMLDPAKMMERFGEHGRALDASRERKAVIVTGHELIASLVIKADKKKAETDEKKARADARATKKAEKMARRLERSGRGVRPTATGIPIQMRMRHHTGTIRTPRLDL